ncbi:hypothetical protein [Echinicola shivajiensis]|uniref:hypothetical protein n=1 Tax=Echinicola shivajiensis TaxID=1035916 RepID=UPI001BFCCB87|nr:hypothetical protein [Echinicola shivajiensis]
MTQFIKRSFFPVLFVALLAFSCTEDDEPVIPQEGIEKANLVFTALSGDDHLSAHGDHFHGIDGATEGEHISVEFDSDGNALSGGHLHLDPEVIYKVELQAWDYQGNRVESDFIKNKATADQYKAFLIGGDFVLNPDTDDESGAIFQAREKEYADGSAVDGKYEVTGILSYLIIGESNEGESKAVSYVLRKFDDPITKAGIERIDWNADDYEERFPGDDVLNLTFEIHAEHEEDDHDHDH